MILGTKKKSEKKCLKVFIQKFSVAGLHYPKPRIFYVDSKILH